MSSFSFVFAFIHCCPQTLSAVLFFTILLLRNVSKSRAGYVQKIHITSDIRKQDPNSNIATAGHPGKGVRSHAHALVHASQHWGVRLIVRLFIKNQLLFTIAPGISNHGLEQLTRVSHFDEQNME